MQPHVERSAQTASHTDQREHEQFLGIEGKVHGEVGDEHGGDGLLALEPDGQ